MLESNAALPDEPSPPPAHVRAMETALAILSDAGRALAEQPASDADLRPIARTLAGAVEAVLDAYDQRRDPVAALLDASAALDAAVAPAEEASRVVPALHPLLEWLASARGWLLTAETAISKAPGAPYVARDVIVARHVPRAFRIVRSVLRPRFVVAEPLPPAAAPTRVPTLDPAASPAERLAETRRRAAAQREAAEQRRLERERARDARRTARAATDDVREGFVAGNHVAIGPDAFVARRARELFEEVTVAGLQRRGQRDEPWRAIDAIDQRMLRAIDALAVLGDRAVRGLEGLVVDAPAKSPQLGFGIAMALGCFEGRDALAAIERVVRFLDADVPAVRASVAEALSLAPHPDVGPFVRGWLRDRDPALRALAIDVLGYRGLATLSDFDSALADDDARVVTTALRWAVLGPEPARTLAREVTARRHGSREPDVVEACTWANTLGGFAGSAEEAEALLDGELEALALRPFVLGCDVEQARRFAAKVEQAPTPGRVAALGWIGLGDSLDLLVSLLDDARSSSDVRDAAASALHRITGHDAFEVVEVPPERIEAEVAPNPDNLPPRKEPLARKVSDPRDMPSDGAPDRVKAPSTQALAWDDYLAREGKRYAPSVRFRRGVPFSCDVVLGELDRAALLPDERRHLFAELVVKSGDVVRFDPRDFVAVQELSIARWRPLAHAASSQPGSWGRPRRK